MWLHLVRPVQSMCGFIFTCHLHILSPCSMGPNAGANSGSTGANSTPSTANPAPPAGGLGAITPELMQQILGGSGGMGAGVPPSSGQQQQLIGSQLQQAEVLYQSQLEQLQTMGFHNRQANLNGEAAVCVWRHSDDFILLCCLSLQHWWRLVAT